MPGEFQGQRSLESPWGRIRHNSATQQQQQLAAYIFHVCVCIYLYVYRSPLWPTLRRPVDTLPSSPVPLLPLPLGTSRALRACSRHFPRVSLRNLISESLTSSPNVLNALHLLPTIITIGLLPVYVLLLSLRCQPLDGSNCLLSLKSPHLEQCLTTEGTQTCAQ